jgi:acyl carrier protein
MQDDIEAAFARILEEVAKVNRADVTADKRIRWDLAIDSLTLIDVAVAAEDAFGVRIPDEDRQCFQVVGMRSINPARQGRRFGLHLLMKELRLAMATAPC